MFSKFRQWSRKGGIAFLLAMMMALMVVMPALAWVPQAAVLTVHCLPCRIICNKSGEVEVYHFKQVPKPRRHQTAKLPGVHPAIERAELIHLTNQ